MPLTFTGTDVRVDDLTVVPVRSLYKLVNKCENPSFKIKLWCDICQTYLIGGEKLWLENRMWNIQSGGEKVTNELMFLHGNCVGDLVEPELPVVNLFHILAPQNNFVSSGSFFTPLFKSEDIFPEINCINWFSIPVLRIRNDLFRIRLWIFRDPDPGKISGSNPYYLVIFGI